MVLTYLICYPQLLRRFRGAVFGKRVFVPIVGTKNQGKSLRPSIGVKNVGGDFL